MLVQTENMIPVTKLQKELMKRLKEVSETDEPLYVLRNNEMAAVIVSAKEFEIFKQAEEAVEFLEVAEMVKQRAGKQAGKKNVPWEKLKNKHAL